MDHQTTVAIHIPLDDGQDKSYVLETLSKAKEYVTARADTYSFQLIFENKTIPAEGLAAAFDVFSKFVDMNFLMNSNDELVSSSFGTFGAEDGTLPDLEGGEIEFTNSFNIEYFEEFVAKIVVYLNLPGFYSSEVEQLPDAGLGLFCDMNDVDGDYYEFEI